METELCHCISFGPNTPSNVVQGPAPHWHLLAGFGDPVLEDGGCGQALVGTCQDLQPCAKADVWLFPVTTVLGRLAYQVDISGYQAPGDWYVKSVLWFFPFSVRSVQAQRHPWLRATQEVLNQNLASAEVVCEPLKKQPWQGYLVAEGICLFWWAHPFGMHHVVHSSRRHDCFFSLKLMSYFHPPNSHVFWFYLVGGGTAAQTVAR